MKPLGKPITKSVSVLLSFIMIMGLFTIVPFSAGAEDGTHTLTVDLFEPSLTNDYYENIALVTEINGSSAKGSSHSVRSGVQISVTFSDRIHTDGEVNIILGDGATVNFQRGIEVGENDTLNVYDQKNGTGKMIALSERFADRDDERGRPDTIEKVR